MKPGELGIARQLQRVLLRVLRDGFVESHYSAAVLAERLGVSERTIWNYVELFETSGGREGLGPVVKLSHKVVRIPASSVNRLLKSRTIASAKVLPFEEDVSEKAGGGA